MTADRQDRKAHHLIAPRPVPAPPLFLPVAHAIIHQSGSAPGRPRPGFRDLRHRLEAAGDPFSGELAKLPGAHADAAAPHVGEHEACFRRRHLVKTDPGRRPGAPFMPVGRDHRRRFPVDEQHGHLIAVFVGCRDNRADQRDSHLRRVLGGGGLVQFKLRHHFGLSSLRWLLPL